MPTSDYGYDFGFFIKLLRVIVSVHAVANVTEAVVSPCNAVLVITICELFTQRESNPLWVR